MTLTKQEAGPDTVNGPIDTGYYIPIAPADRDAFRTWANDELAGRWELGRQRYHQVSPDFHGSPLQHTVEETLDQIVYLWVERRRLIELEAAGVVATAGLDPVLPMTPRRETWRLMNKTAQAEFHEWLNDELTARWRGVRVEEPSDSGWDPRWVLYDRAVFHALGMLAALWQMKRAAGDL